MTENALSILSVIFSVQLQQTEISEKAVYFPPRLKGIVDSVISFFFVISIVFDSDRGHY